MSRTLFTSDTHWYHKNIIKYSGRPFEDVQEMNEKLINRWNTAVRPQDNVYHLGDFSFGNYDQTKNILKRLAGHKHFVKGNHDEVFEKNPDLYDYFDSVQNYKELKINGQHLVLFHFPIAT